jgi:histidyl-tRNA synthetase
MSEYKVPKGTRDSNPETEKLRQKLIEECEKQFLLYNAVRIDTPTFELYSLLMEKYNDENTKEIYVLENKNDNGEKCALRYDLTVPFSRYVKTNHINNIRKYQIGKVFRRDNPSPGRYREFYQCDYDCLGDNIEWITDAETLLLLNNILAVFRDKYNMPNYVIRINSREILLDMMIACNISPELFSATCSCIDKLDKCEWKKVSSELLAKGICQESINKLESILQQS